jgi:epoxyqueuosine reductase
MTQTAETILDRHQLAAEVKNFARRLGFDLVGIADASPSAYRQYYRDWLDAGRAGEMTYLHRRFDERTNPGAYLPGARTVICVALNYHVPLDPPPPSQEHRGRVARYALGEDYHELIKPKLYALADWLRDVVPGVQTRCGVDTAPILEKELAARAGVGWIGKNTCLINPKIGSWLLLGEVITTADLAADAPASDHCGTCTRCIDACPTHAITAPYQLDARRCISYLTIEHRGEIDANLKSQISDWLYGCDVCQDVCPHNAQALPTATDPALRPRFGDGTVDVRDVLEWDTAAYAANLRGSAMRRVKLPVLQRSARIVADNLAS